MNNALILVLRISFNFLMIIDSSEVGMKIPSLGQIFEVYENISLYNNITNVIQVNLRRSCGMINKRKLIYYRKVINPNIKIQKRLYILFGSMKKINISKIRTNYIYIWRERRGSKFIKRLAPKEIMLL